MEPCQPFRDALNKLLELGLMLINDKFWLIHDNRTIHKKLIIKILKALKNDIIFKLI